jgi:hypothetical protein
VTFQALLYPFLPEHYLKVKDMGNANYGCKNRTVTSQNRKQK